jgi:error-prone DNA polymerase
MLTPDEQLNFDLWATGISPNDHPMRFVREELESRGVLAAEDLLTAESGRRLEVGGIVIHRQRPSTAGGVTFLNLEDETGMVNVICTLGVWNRFRSVARLAPAMIVRGILERSHDQVTNLIADHFEAIVINSPVKSRDFH